MIIEMPRGKNEADSCRQILEANNFVKNNYPYPVSRIEKSDLGKKAVLRAIVKCETGRT